MRNWSLLFRGSSSFPPSPTITHLVTLHRRILGRDIELDLVQSLMAEKRRLLRRQLLRSIDTDSGVVEVAGPASLAENAIGRDFYERSEVAAEALHRRLYFSPFSEHQSRAR